MFEVVGISEHTLAGSRVVANELNLLGRGSTVFSVVLVHGRRGAITGTTRDKLVRADGSRRRAPLGGCLIVRELGRRLSLQNLRHNLILNLLSTHLSDVLDVVLLFDSVHDESVASGLAGKARCLHVVGLLRRRSRVASSSRVLLDQGARPGG